MYRYRQFMKRCLVYCARAARFGRELAQQRHEVEWTDAQWKLRQDIGEELPQRRPVGADMAEEERAEEETELGQMVFKYCISMLR